MLPSKPCMHESIRRYSSVNPMWQKTLKMQSLFLVEIDGCEQIMDIAILADRSRSMSNKSREKLSEAVKNLVDDLGVSETGNHFGFVTFAVNATLHSKFSDSFYYNAEKLKSKVDEEVNFTPDRDATRTDLAMQLIENELFTSDGGQRNNSRSFLLLITDGRPVHVNKEWDKRPQINTSNITERLEVIIFRVSFKL